MKLSLQWIRKYVALPKNLEVSTLVHDLTMRTVEVEDAFNPADSLEKIVVGVVADIQPHPQADMLRVCLVDIGNDAPSTIVCGGSNIKAGMSVAVAVPGAKVRWHGEGEPVLIKTTKLRGVKSDGMICAAREMELEDLFPAKDDHEILDLTGFPAKPGTPVSEALGLDDIIIEIDNKSLTNRPDLWCHYGIARELAAIYSLELKPLPIFSPPKTLSEYPVTIKNPVRCRRYAALQYEGLNNLPSPYWLQTCLWKIGIRPISSLVDITNYVMLDVGQPTHAFDKNQVNQEIIVRNALPDEGLTLLGGKNLKLTEEDLMICDMKEPIALGGVMGGAKDSISPNTDNMLLEIANFEPKGIRRSAARHQVRTESAIRNEKGLDTQRVEQAMAVADQLIRQLYPSARITAFTDQYPNKTETISVEVNLDWLNKRLGRVVSTNQIKKLLSPLGFVQQNLQDSILITVPTWRATGDVSQKEDILEEIARMLGYEHFEFIPPSIKLETAINQPRMTLERKTREYLAFQCAMQEVFTYPWVHQQFLKAACIQPDQCLQLSAPPSPEYSCLRSSLVPAMLETCSQNLRYLDVFSIFELAQVFLHGETHPSEIDETLPLQQRYLAMAMVGKDARTLFRTAKGVVELLPKAVMSEPLSFTQKEQPLWADAKAWLNIVSQDEVIGSMGLISIQSAKAADIKRAQVAIVEINMEKIIPLPSRSNQFQPLPLFPLVDKDFSVLLDEKVSWDDISKSLESLVRSIIFVEEYRGKQIPEGKKSLMFSVTLGSDQGTLTTHQIDEKIASIKKRLTKLGGELRM